jgi:hypothetical protein
MAEAASTAAIDLTAGPAAAPADATEPPAVKADPDAPPGVATAPAAATPADAAPAAASDTPAGEVVAAAAPPADAAADAEVKEGGAAGSEDGPQGAPALPPGVSRSTPPALPAAAAGGDDDDDGGGSTGVAEAAAPAPVAAPAAAAAPASSGGTLAPPPGVVAKPGAVAAAVAAAAGMVVEAPPELPEAPGAADGIYGDHARWRRLLTEALAAPMPGAAEKFEQIVEVFPTAAQYWRPYLERAIGCAEVSAVPPPPPPPAGGRVAPGFWMGPPPPPAREVKVQWDEDTLGACPPSPRMLWAVQAEMMMRWGCGWGVSGAGGSAVRALPAPVLLQGSVAALPALREAGEQRRRPGPRGAAAGPRY